MRYLKTRLGLGGVVVGVPRDEAGDEWSNVIGQDLSAVSAEGWGKRLVAACRSGRKRGIEDFSGWKSHVEFFVHVNKFHPHLAGAIYLYLNRMREERGDDPGKSSFGKLVRFGVQMVARLGWWHGRVHRAMS